MPSVVPTRHARLYVVVRLYMWSTRDYMWSWLVRIVGASLSCRDRRVTAAAAAVKYRPKTTAPQLLSYSVTQLLSYLGAGEAASG
jgi:hypothetical protein